MAIVSWLIDFEAFLLPFLSVIIMITIAYILLIVVTSKSNYQPDVKNSCSFGYKIVPSKNTSQADVKNDKRINFPSPLPSFYRISFPFSNCGLLLVTYALN